MPNLQSPDFFRPMEHLHFGRLPLRSPLQAVLIRRADKRPEQRMGLEWLRFEFRMELAAYKMRMVWKFDNLNVSSIRRRSGDTHSGSRHRLFIFAIEFVPMPVALADLRRFVNSVSKRAGLDLADPRAQSHRSAEFFDAPQLAQFVDDTMWCRRIELARIRIFQTDYVARKLDAGRLHSQ